MTVTVAIPLPGVAPSVASVIDPVNCNGPSDPTTDEAVMDGRFAPDTKGSEPV